MFIALPNLDGSFTCTLFLPHEGDNSFAALTDEDKVKDFFEVYFPTINVKFLISFVISLKTLPVHL